MIKIPLSQNDLKRLADIHFITIEQELQVSQKIRNRQPDELDDLFAYLLQKID